MKIIYSIHARYALMIMATLSGNDILAMSPRDRRTSPGDLRKRGCRSGKKHDLMVICPAPRTCAILCSDRK